MVIKSCRAATNKLEISEFEKSKFIESLKLKSFEPKKTIP